VADVVAWDALPDDAGALDVVYAPPETAFLRRARSRGLRSANGLGMLARQGALALKLWLGRDAPLDAMRAALESRL
jgi:shikimate dehydrogenase